MNDKPIEGEIVEETGMELAKSTAIVKVIDVEGTLQAYKEFEQIKTKLLGVNDYLYFDKYGKAVYDGSGIRYIKKSGWRKAKTAFGISIEYLDDGIRAEQEDDEGKYYVWSYKVRAIAPNGIYQDAVGVSTSRNPFFSVRYVNGKKTRINPAENNIMLTAQTIAINRAVSDLVGGGEVSAEEMQQATGDSLPSDAREGTSKARTEQKGTSGEGKKEYPSNREVLETFEWDKYNDGAVPPNEGWTEKNGKKFPPSNPLSQAIYHMSMAIIKDRKEAGTYIKNIVNKNTWDMNYGELKKVSIALIEMDDDLKSDKKSTEEEGRDMENVTDEQLEMGE